MSKGLGFVLFVFFALVSLDLLFSLASHILPPLNLASAGVGSVGAPTFSESENGNDNGYGLSVVDASLFSPTGAGKSIVTQGYGHTPYSAIYPNDWHDGIDIGANYGEPIYSPNGGTVIAVGNQDLYCYHRAFGKYVAVKDPANNLVLWYAHLGTQVVSPGETITKGQELGTVGATGLETGVHLHFSIFEAAGFTMQVRDGCGPEPTGQDVNPLNYLGTVYQ